jgi:hypothetical protein
LEKVSNKPFLRGRLTEEFNKFTAEIFGNNQSFISNRDTKFETAISEAVVDYNERRVSPIETKNIEQDRRLDDHENRIRKLELQILELSRSRQI